MSYRTLHNIIHFISYLFPFFFIILCNINVSVARTTHEGCNFSKLTDTVIAKFAYVCLSSCTCIHVCAPVCVEIVPGENVPRRLCNLLKQCEFRRWSAENTVEARVIRRRFHYRMLDLLAGDFKRVHRQA